jgi:uncharacterized protein (TIGR02588 family)
MSETTGVKEARHLTGWMWAVAVVGFVLVAGTIGFFIYQAATANGAPADIVIETGPIEMTDGGYLVPLEVSNHGEEVAAGLLVEGALLDGETEVEMSSFTFDYLAVGSTRHGRLIFAEDPREYELEVQARGYALP